MEEVRGSSPLLRTKGKGQAERLVSFCPWCAIRDSLPVLYAGKRIIRGALYRGKMPRYIRGKRAPVKEICHKAPCKVYRRNIVTTSVPESLNKQRSRISFRRPIRGALF